MWMCLLIHALNFMQVRLISEKGPPPNGWYLLVYKFELDECLMMSFD